MIKNSLPISSKLIRKQFIDFFKSKEHTFVRSSSVAPNDDPTLLFTNAGMNQFKPIFLGHQKPEYPCVANSQKCIRVSGKHNDLEEVGVDDYHHTFFEMLGNWSFGNYYKEDAIKWAWELLTEVWGIDKNRLWVTIFKDDDESGEIWENVTDISSNRVLKYGHKDNFWEMGETGPCGPCTEIHYYSGDDPENQIAEGVNRDHEYREIWNLVFIQYNRDKNGKLTDLPNKHVDTGAGFERIVALLNGKVSNYDTDLFIPITDKIVELSGKSLAFEDGIPHRVIADHLRMLSFSIADGAMPGNEGRSYVLRRVLRRAARFGRVLEMKKPFIYELVNVLVQTMGDAFPELKEKQIHIEKVIKAEEQSFSETLDRGLEIFEKLSGNLKKGDTISGDDAFKLYDTFGFPLDLTELIARDKGLSVDIKRFDECMAEQKTRARASGGFKLDENSDNWTIILESEKTEFIGYDESECETEITKYRKSKNGFEIVLKQSPFYPEQGGQIGDKGLILSNNFKFQVNNTQKDGKEIIHIGKIISGEFSTDEKVSAKIDENYRQDIRLNHTATHLLHKSLKLVLGNHVNQAGSLVENGRLRFDLTHYERLNQEQIIEIENLVNNAIRDNFEVITNVQDYESARDSGAEALFGEKYGDEVRVVSISDYSKELCGGTHVIRTGDIGSFKIISESALASGVRRIEAITGRLVNEYLQVKDQKLNSIQSLLKCSEKDIQLKLNQLLDERKKLNKQIKELSSANQGDVIEALISKSIDFNGVKLLVELVDEIDDLKAFGDKFRELTKEKSIALIGTILNEKPMIVCAVSDDLTKLVKAGDVVREVGKQMGGGGGGKPHLATAGGKDVDSLESALKYGKQFIKSKV
jgi:alanyl-tRNA synthetase